MQPRAEMQGSNQGVFEKKDLARLRLAMATLDPREESGAVGTTWSKTSLIVDNAPRRLDHGAAAVADPTLETQL